MKQERYPKKRKVTLGKNNNNRNKTSIAKIKMRQSAGIIANIK